MVDKILFSKAFLFWFFKSLTNISLNSMSKALFFQAQGRNVRLKSWTCRCGGVKSPLVSEYLH